MSAVDEYFLLRLLPALPAQDVEVYSHPSLDEYRNEFEAFDQSCRIEPG